MGPRCRTAILIGLVGLVLPPTANAATLGAGQFIGELRLVAPADERNRIEMSIGGEGKSLIVEARDRGRPLEAGRGCARAGGKVTCGAGGLYLVTVSLGDRRDVLDIHNTTGDVQVTAALGAGADRATVGPNGGLCMSAGSGADRVVVSVATKSCAIDGGSGNDRLEGSPGQDRLDGGDDDDRLIGNGGVDYVDGGGGDDREAGGTGNDFLSSGNDEGDDRVRGGPGDDAFTDRAGEDAPFGGGGNDSFTAAFYNGIDDDVITGGSGFDSYDYLCPSCNVFLDGRPNDGARSRDEHDDLDVERIQLNSFLPANDGTPAQAFGSGRDRVVGDDRSNVIATLRGPDSIVGGGGSDELRSGNGNDVLRTVDGRADAVVDCGRGRDRAVVDPADEPVGCERVRVTRLG